MRKYKFSQFFHRTSQSTNRKENKRAKKILNLSSTILSPATPHPFPHLPMYAISRQTQAQLAANVHGATALYNYRSLKMNGRKLRGKKLKIFSYNNIKLYSFWYIRTQRRKKAHENINFIEFFISLHLLRLTSSRIRLTGVSKKSLRDSSNA